MSLVFQNIDPPPPLRPACVYPPPLLGGGGGHTHPGGERGGGSIFWKTRDIGLPSYSNNLSKGIGLGPWQSTLFCPLILVSSFSQCISVSEQNISRSRIQRYLTWGKSQLRLRIVVSARQPCSLACRYDNPMPELTLFPSQGSMNSATDFVR